MFLEGRGLLVPSYEEMKARHPGWIWPRGDTHIVIGVPQSLDAFKTFVEPGGSFSPGVRSFGVSLWIYDRAGGKLHAPEAMAEKALKWRFRRGYIPVLHCEWQAGPVHVETTLSADGDTGASEIVDTFTARVRNNSSADANVTVYLAIRSMGPAGGPVSALGLAPSGTEVLVNGAPLVFAERKPDGWGCVSYSLSGKDISEYLLEGKLPDEQSISDKSTWGSGALAYELNLPPGQEERLGWVFPVHLSHPLLKWVKAPSQPLNLEDREKRCEEFWEKALGSVKLDVPDSRFRDAFYAQLVHMWTATVGDDVRISSVHYPLPWLRDSVYILNALDKGGFSEFTAKACERMAVKDAFGGFGAEADGPGQGAWVISEHFRLTKDLGWLDAVYPHLKRRAELIVRMRRTDRPLKMFSECCIPEALLNPAVDLLCLSAEDGLIQGRMDWHFPVFWVNCWSLCGLERAVEAAEVLGHSLDSQKYRKEAAELRDALLRAVPKQFGSNERDFACALWPTKALSGEHPRVRAAFQQWWSETRFRGGIYRAEPLWTYFEVAQAHNLLFLGEREKAWATVENFLSNHAAPGLYAYHEGDGDENSSGLWELVRGWQPVPKVVPHGWTSAELFLLLRDCMLYEEHDHLVVGAGVPEAWMSNGAEFGISGAPTYFGRAGWNAQVSFGTVRLQIEAERPPNGGYVILLPLLQRIEELTVGRATVPPVREHGGLLVPATGRRTSIVITFGDRKKMVQL
ncbi:MAG: hypothetical protein ACP5R4_04405 [Armatimonadota bacterium]